DQAAAELVDDSVEGLMWNRLAQVATAREDDGIFPRSLEKPADQLALADARGPADVNDRRRSLLHRCQHGIEAGQLRHAVDEERLGMPRGLVGSDDLTLEIERAKQHFGAGTRSSIRFAQPPHPP